MAVGGGQMKASFTFFTLPVVRVSQNVHLVCHRGAAWVLQTEESAL